MPAVANKIIEKLEIAKDNFSVAIALEERSKDSAISKAEDYLLTLRAYLETMQQRMGAKIILMQKLKKALLEKQGRGKTEELPVFGAERETRGVLPAVRTMPAVAKKRQTFAEQEQILEEIYAFKKLLSEVQEHLTEFNLALANYLVKIGNKYKFLILADEEVAYLPELKGKLDREIPEEIGNLRTAWEYFNSLDNDLMDTVMAWSVSADKKKSELESIEGCAEIFAEFEVFLRNAKSKIDRLGKHFKIQCGAHFEELMSVTYDLFKKAKSILED